MEKFSITTLPDDIVRDVTLENWEELFNEHMVIQSEGKEHYIWTADVMREFIRNLIKDASKKLGGVQR